METDPALAPPVLMEHIVQWFIPPRVREAVMGDLREIYSTPSQYLIEAVKTVPLVFVSCAIRALNIPVLLLQLTLLFFFLEKLHAQFHLLTQTDIGQIGALAMFAIILRDTYQQDGRALASRGILESIAVALFLVLVCQDAFGLKPPAVGTPDFNLEFQFFVILPLAVPLLGVIRTLLIVQGDHDLGCFTDTVDRRTIAHGYAQLSRKLRYHYLAQALILLLGAVFLIAFLGTVWLAALYAVVAVFMLAPYRAAVMHGTDSRPTISEFRRLLSESQQMRQLLTWLWASPVLLAICDRLILAGFSHHRAVLVSIGSALAILMCFFVDSLNKELTGQVTEKTRMLERQTVSGL